MKKLYKITELMPTWVLYTHTVTAESEAEAKRAFADGAADASAEEPALGAKIPGLTIEFEIEEIEGIVTLEGPDSALRNLKTFLTGIGHADLLEAFTATDET